MSHHELADLGPRTRTAGAALLLALALGGCGGESTTSNPLSSPDTGGAQYRGPAPASSDVQAFRINVWDNLRETDGANRCGGCHGTGGQTPTFVRTDDVNLAYQQARTVVDLADPAASGMVTKVGGGHNCWEASDAACAALLTSWIEAWASGGTGAGNVIALQAPSNLRAPGDSIEFPQGSGLFASTVHPLLTAHCADCHTETVLLAQSPFFATTDADLAYEAAKPKMDLADPAASRLVVRLREESHNCWSDCAANAGEMQQRIADLAAGGTLVSVSDDLVTSMAITLPEGTVASGGGRHDDNAIALYQFKAGAGNTVVDTSITSRGPLNLTLSGDVEWVGGWGIRIGPGGKAQGSTAASQKLYDLIQATGEYSIEAWVVPANVTQEDANIVSYSGGTVLRNFTLGQTLYNYDFLHRSAASDANGQPALSTADADEDLQATLQHVVVTYDPVEGRRIYVNGRYTDDLDPQPGGSLGGWNDSYALVLGNEVSGTRPWLGTLRLVAIHNRALSPEQITDNFEAGVGERFFLLFAVEQLTGVPRSYVVFEVSQFDDYSYLFNAPFFVSLDETADPDGIPIEGMRIGINGKEVAVGQAYASLDVDISRAEYGPGGQTLSPYGTVIALEQGPQADEFFLTFDRIGGQASARTPPAVPAPAPAVDGSPVPDIGLRRFSEINASMSAVTTVPTTDPAVASTYETVKQQLPTVENIEGFLSAHQMAVSQLAIEYCNALVEDGGRRAAFFGAFGFTQDVATAFGTGDSAQKNQVVDALYDRMILAGLDDVPTRAELKWELVDPANTPGGSSPDTGGNLFDKLTAGCAPGCDAQRTRTIVKAMCAATLGSGALLLQ